jgi:DNA-binding NarL/FixJ family response regulator
MKENCKRTVLVCDDSATSRAAIHKLMKHTENNQIIGSACDGQEAVQLAKILRPDVVILDVEMPKLNGIEAAIQIKNALPNTIVIMLSSRDDDFSIFKSLFAGADGYCVKRHVWSLPGIIKEAVRTALSKSDAGSVSARSRLIAV